MSTVGVLLGWPEVISHILVGVAATTLIFGALFAHGGSPLAAAWRTGRSMDAPEKRHRRLFNRVTGLVVLVPLLGVLVILVAYFGWWLIEIGWISVGLIALTVLGAWFLGRAIGRSNVSP